MGLQRFERRLERMVEGTFAKAFRAGLEPVEIGRKIARALDTGRMIGVHGGWVVPNDVVVYLSADDMKRFSTYTDALSRELADAARQYARDEGYHFLGPVTVERGYAYAGAIIDNRSDESVIGGGLCQVSTTIFNAVAQQGYEIVERHEHGYLIERYPTGLDAAVFQPGLDMRWRNDTASPVFLWSWVGDTSVTFEVWGVPTGRTVSFTDPVQYRFVDVPKDQPADPAFPKGYAIRGRDVVRTRTVTENGTVLHQDTWYSHYAPVWGGPAEAGQSLTIR